MPHSNFHMSIACALTVMAAIVIKENISFRKGILSALLVFTQVLTEQQLRCNWTGMCVPEKMVIGWKAPLLSGKCAYLDAESSLNSGNRGKNETLMSRQRYHIHLSCAMYVHTNEQLGRWGNPLLIYNYYKKLIPHSITNNRNMSCLLILTSGFIQYTASKYNDVFFIFKVIPVP